MCIFQSLRMRRRSAQTSGPNTAGPVFGIYVYTSVEREFMQQQQRRPIEGGKAPLLEYWGAIPPAPSFCVKCACAVGARTAAPMSLCRLILVVLLCGVRVGQ